MIVEVWISLQELQKWPSVSNERLASMPRRWNCAPGAPKFWRPIWLMPTPRIIWLGTSTNYLARDIDFKATLSGLSGRENALKVTHAVHMQARGSASGELLYRTPAQMAIDGNTVEEEQEKSAFADNAMRYQASLRLLGNRVQGLLSAIRGE